MNAIIIHQDGRAELVFGEHSGDLTPLAVLTQAAVAAFEQEGGKSSAIQCYHEKTWVTLLRQEDDSWLRVCHEAGVTAEQVRAWAASLQPAKPKPPPGRITSLADALNVVMP
jgi:hypothetical protein